MTFYLMTKTNDSCWEYFAKAYTTQATQTYLDDSAKKMTDNFYEIYTNQDGGVCRLFRYSVSCILYYKLLKIVVHSSHQQIATLSQSSVSTSFAQFRFVSVLASSILYTYLLLFLSATTFQNSQFWGDVVSTSLEKQSFIFWLIL